jgi:hypothetical protein
MAASHISAHFGWFFQLNAPHSVFRVGHFIGLFTIHTKSAAAPAGMVLSLLY